MFSPQRNAWSRPRGARHLMYFRFECETMFQSTRPRGARQRRCSVGLSRFGVSIHAPAWGATQQYTRLAILLLVSIHAPAWGATAASGGDFSFALFQSTRPRGARLMSVSRFSARRWFQSTRPRGARHKRLSLLSCGQQVSIHAPTWGATLFSLAISVPGRVSIHAPAWGATV